jgi:hypothetical protein
VNQRALLFIMCVFPVLAQADDTEAASRVARLKDFAGNVTMRSAASDNWGPAVVNRPLVAGDTIWVDQGGRATVDAGSTTVRLAESTNFAVFSMAPGLLSLRLTQGTVHMRIRSLAPREGYSIVTPNGEVAALRTGSYRVDVDTDAHRMTVTVRDGEAEVNTGAEPRIIRAQGAERFTGEGQVTAEMLPLPAPDGTDQWCDREDAREDEAVLAASPHVSTKISGITDLGASAGEWFTGSPQGDYWIPSGVSADWAPYRYGSWMFIDPWGWTWVDEAPWGFAPFHYGRWAMVGPRWAWFPGPPLAQPLFAPALVAFVGGAGFAAAIGAGYGPIAAWVPLGPREPFRPWYLASPLYVARVNAGQAYAYGNITYVNRTYVTAVPQAAFTSGRSIRRDIYPVPASAAMRAQTVPLLVRPSLASRTGYVAPGSLLRVPPARFANRTVLAATAPTRATGPYRLVNPTGSRTSGWMRYGNVANRAAPQTPPQPATRWSPPAKQTPRPAPAARSYQTPQTRPLPRNAPPKTTAPAARTPPPARTATRGK